jgi:hypothetical protein
VLAEHMKLEARLKQQIQQRMGDATAALFNGGSVSWRRSKDSSSFDLGVLLKEHPQLRERFTATVPGTRRFLVNSSS